MKHSHHAQSATSLPRAPRDDADARSTRYLLLMGIRIACLLLMVLITPYGWHTAALGAAAVFLPYVAVVSANVGQEARRNRREDPERMLPPAPARSVDAAPNVIRVTESPPTADPAREAPTSRADPEPGEDRPPRPDEAA